MKVLWVGPFEESGGSGEVVFDRKISSLGPGIGITYFKPRQHSKLFTGLQLALGESWYHARYKRRSQIQEVKQAAQEYDAVVCSWEHYDFFVRYLDRPVVAILHNVTSQAFPSMFPGNMLAKLVSRRSAAVERELYNSPNLKEIITLSKRDQEFVQAIALGTPVRWAPPGAPAAVALAPDAIFCEDIILSGSYDWRVKKRDLKSFLDDIRDEPGLSVVSDDPLPSDCRLGSPLEAANLGSSSNSGKIRIGLIADRFVAGHKLKVAQYVANNSVILSYADILGEYSSVKHFDRFIRVVSGPSDIRKEIKSWKNVRPQDFRREFTEFKESFLSTFDWDLSRGVLRTALKNATASCSQAVGARVVQSPDS